MPTQATARGATHESPGHYTCEACAAIVTARMSPKKIQKLADKKYRQETGLFIVEGDKNIRELLNSDMRVETLIGTGAFLDAILPLVRAYESRMKTTMHISEVSTDILEKTGTLMTNNAGIAVAHTGEEPSIDTILDAAATNIVLALDDVRDPGNLGTIIRIADWYGVAYIAASPTTTDVYNPKTISATMGSFTRMQVAYTDIGHLAALARARAIPVIAADMEGASTHTGTLPHTGILVMGSESHGVSDSVLAHTSHRVTIPRFGGAESLNVSVATGILLDTLRRGT